MIQKRNPKKQRALLSLAGNFIYFIMEIGRIVRSEIVIIIVTLLAVGCNRTNIKISKSNRVYTNTEISPTYPGGGDAMERFITEEVNWEKLHTDEEGQIFVSITVLKSGDLTDIKVLDGLCNICDENAVRVIKKMPRWVPGEQGGEFVNSKTVIIIKKP